MVHGQSTLAFIYIICNLERMVGDSAKALLQEAAWKSGMLSLGTGPLLFQGSIISITALDKESPSCSEP